MLHGPLEAKNSEKTAEKTFKDKSIGKDLPVIRIKKDEIVNGIDIFNIVLKTKLASSKGEIRRMIKNNGLKINNEIITDSSKKIYIESFDINNNIKVSHGKKQHIILKII
jgi:tyrosyl-tRNA synthetase